LGCPGFLFHLRKSREQNGREDADDGNDNQ